MHLDTVMTMVDGERFIKYAGLGMLPAYTIERGDNDKELQVTAHEPDAMHDAIAAPPGLDSLEVLTPESAVVDAGREHGAHDSNVLSTRRGRVRTHARTDPHTPHHSP